MARGWAHQNILYSTPSVPTDLNNEADIAFSKANEVRRILLLSLRRPYVAESVFVPG